MVTQAAEAGQAVPGQKKEVLEAGVTPQDVCGAHGTLLPSSVTS